MVQVGIACSSPYSPVSSGFAPQWWITSQSGSSERSESERKLRDVSSLIASSPPHTTLVAMAIVPASLRVSNLTPTRALWIGIVFGLTLTASIDACARFVHQRRQREKRRRLQRGPKRPRAGQITVERDEIVRGVEGLIGNTPLIRINSLSNLVSNLTGLKVEIVGKCEFMNPFGSVKDRVSREIVRHAEQNGLVEPNSGSTLFEGTSGSTGISIAGIAKARGYNARQSFFCS